MSARALTAALAMVLLGMPPARADSDELVQARLATAYGVRSALVKNGGATVVLFDDDDGERLSYQETLCKISGLEMLMVVTLRNYVKAHRNLQNAPPSNYINCNSLTALLREREEREKSEETKAKSAERFKREIGNSIIEKVIARPNVINVAFSYGQLIVVYETNGRSVTSNADWSALDASWICSLSPEIRIVVSFMSLDLSDVDGSMERLSSMGEYGDSTYCSS